MGVEAIDLGITGSMTLFTCSLCMLVLYTVNMIVKNQGGDEK